MSLTYRKKSQGVRSGDLGGQSRRCSNLFERPCIIVIFQSDFFTVTSFDLIALPHDGAREFRLHFVLAFFLRSVLRTSLYVVALRYGVVYEVGVTSRVDRYNVVNYER